MPESNVAVKIRKDVIDEIDNIRTARMTRTEFINTVLADWLLDSYRSIRAEGPYNPKQMEWESWMILMQKKHRTFQQTLVVRDNAGD
jgi:hypothetical protein